jgi:hypothetical protein
MEYKYLQYFNVFKQYAVITYSRINFGMCAFVQEQKHVRNDFANKEPYFINTAVL